MKKQLTIEEKLQNALVPKEEQPYKIPSNWCWGILGEITSVIGGGTPSSKINEYYDNGDIAWITPSDLSNYNNMYISKGKKMITKLGLMKSSAKLLPKGTVCLSSRAPIGYVVIAKNELSTNQGFKSFLPSKVFKSEYLYWYLKSIKHILEAKASGTTFLELSAKKAGEVEIPLPPIKEQQRIVNRIESLFAKLDRAKELIENTLAQFEQNKMAILHKAFTGELTVKWRKENNINEKNFFNKVKLKNVIKLISGRDVSVSLCNDKSIGIPYILGASNIKDNKFFIERWIENPVVVSEKNDILLSVKGTIGKLYLQKEEKINISRQIMALRALNELNTHYLYYFLLRECERLKFEGNGLIPGISRKDILDLNILLPTLEEQQEIVNILDRLLAKYNKIKNLEQQLEKIELLKKAILAKAFRGELGTNNPDEESAENLLKEILAEK